MKIICGKFDNQIKFKIPPTKRLRIGSVNPKNRKKTIFIPIATNGNNILYQNKIFATREFLNNYVVESSTKLIVLTNKEKELILEELIDFDMNILIFENLYPIFNNIKYVSNLEKNYQKLIELLNLITDLGFYGESLTKSFSRKYLYQIERKLRIKTNLDEFFAFAYKGGYQEVFKLKEERQNRVVISFDFNSMFIDSMMGSFLEPKSIKYKNFMNKNIDLNELENGLYRVILKNPKETFFQQFHPFKYTRLFQSFYFNLESTHNVEILLYKNEINYYKKFFNKIEILEGFFSKKTIPHPLVEFSKEIYAKRLQYKKEGNLVMSNLMKLKLITIHSATNPKKSNKIFFFTKEKLIKYLSDKYMLNISLNEFNEEFRFITQHNKNFIIDKINNSYKTKLISFDKNESIYSFSSQIIANSRLKMIETIEKFLLHKSVEICYTNIDSIHISILKTEVDNFLLSFKDIISTKIGDLKIETIADRGYWFDVGRYWLFKDNHVHMFKNKIFNYKGNNNYFLKSRKFKFIHTEPSFIYVKTGYINLINSFSYSKRVKIKYIDNLEYTRYNFSEINNLNVANKTINTEILNSKRKKMDLFNIIATV